MIDVLISRKKILNIRKALKELDKKIVFTNGCFDILHAGHVDYLAKAKEKGDILILGLNSDASVKRLKGEKRPIINQKERAFLLYNLKSVDYVTLFEEDTPEELIGELIPDMLVKGSDWPIDQIVGKSIVEQKGGKVESIEIVTDQSTSKIVERIYEIYK